MLVHHGLMSLEDLLQAEADLAEIPEIGGASAPVIWKRCGAEAARRNSVAVPRTLGWRRRVL